MWLCPCRLCNRKKSWKILWVVLHCTEPVVVTKFLEKMLQFSTGLQTMFQDNCRTADKHNTKLDLLRLCITSTVPVSIEERTLLKRSLYNKIPSFMLNLVLVLIVKQLSILSNLHRCIG